MLVPALLLAGLSAGLTPAQHDWLTQATRAQLEGSRVPAAAGFLIYTPDGMGNYRALWTRDYAYMIAQAWDLLDPAAVKPGLRHILSGQRADGCMPDRVNPDGHPIYSPGGDNNPLADCALDNGPFAALAVCSYVRQSGDLAFLREVEPALHRGLAFVPLDPASGLVWNDPAKPNCPYGFTDVVVKTGLLLDCSLYFIQACRALDAACALAGVTPSAPYAAWADRTQSSLSLLWDEQTGLFFAASIDCRQHDIWMNALAVHLDLATPAQSTRILDYLVAHLDGLSCRGQIRHLPAGEYWQRVFADRFHQRDTYQNGAFWATPLAWFLPALARRDPALAHRLLQEVLSDFQTHGIWECIHGDQRKLPNFVASATAVYAASRSLLPATP